MRVLKTAIKSFFQNFLMSMASIVSITATLVILGMALLLVVNLNQLSVEMLQRVDLGTIRVTEDLTPQQAKEIEQRLSKLDNIASIEYITKQEVLDRYVSSLEEEDASLFEGMADRLFSIFEVRLKDTAKMNDTIVALRAELTDIGVFGQEKDAIKFEQDLTDRLLSLSRIVKSVATVIIAALLIITIIIVNNTIRSALTAQSMEISIMRYVGATRSYIRRPFIIEAVFFGLLGSVLAGVLLYFGYQQVLTFIENQMNFSGNNKFSQDVSVLYNIGILNIIIGVGVSLIGSIFSLRRYLKV